MYDKKNAKEMVRINESKIYTTCGEVSILPLVNNELLNRNEYSIAYWLGLKDYVRSDDAVYNHDPKFLLNKDGTINKYLYNDVVHNVVKDALIKNEKGENLLVSFVYVLNDKVNIIDTEGNIYQINTIDKYKGDTLTEFKLNKINQNKKVKNIELKLQYHAINYRYSEEKIYRNPNLTLLFDDGTKETYSYENYKIEFDNHYINQ